MSSIRRAKKIDSNQPAIVEALRKIPNLSVELDKDDIFVGYKGVNYWYEIKDPEKVFNKDMTFKKGAIKDTQTKLLAEWKGHYKIVWSLDMILEDIGIN